MSEKKRGVAPPNFTQIPNAILDAMADMGEPELRVVLAVARKTFGWQKKRDQISLSQLESLTGLSRPSVLKGIGLAEARGLIKRQPVAKGDNEKGFFFSLVVNDVNHSEEQVVNDVNPPSKRRLPLPTREVVNDVYPQNKVNKLIQKKKDSRGATDAPAQPSLLPDVSQKPPSQHQAIITTYVQELGYTPQNMGREAKAAKWLAANAYTPEQVIACYRHMKADKFWKDKPLSLQKVADAIPEFNRAAPVAVRASFTAAGARHDR